MNRRNLKGRYIDLIREGVAPADLRKAGWDVAVFNALVQTASSACQRGWDRPEWEALVTEAGSRLGTQVRLRDGKRERTNKAVARTLNNAWTKAEKWVSEQPPAIDRESALIHARKVRDWVADADVELPPAERAILAHAAAAALEKGTDRPTLPRAQMLAATGLGLTALRSALDRLHRQRLLVLEVRGRPGGPATKDRRANAYRLPSRECMDTYQYRETRSVVPPALVCGAPQFQHLGAQHWSVVPPIPHDPEQKGHHMVTLTLSAATPEALAAALDALQRRGEVQIAKPEADPPQVSGAADETNVVPIRRTSKVG